MKLNYSGTKLSYGVTKVSYVIMKLRYYIMLHMNGMKKYHKAVLAFHIPIYFLFKITIHSASNL